MNRGQVSLFLAFALASGTSLAGLDTPCPSYDLEELRARRDYNAALVSPDRSVSGDWHRLRNVEEHHFNHNVRNLIRGQSVTHPGGDLMFILRVFPNHAPALAALVRLALRERTDKARGVASRVHCTLELAVNFRPDDPKPRILYGIYLAKLGSIDEAISQLEIAEKAAPNDANALYNLGLLYFQRGEYAASLAYAKRAYSLGFPLAGLREKLASRGLWLDEPQ